MCPLSYSTSQFLQYKWPIQDTLLYYIFSSILSDAEAILDADYLDVAIAYVSVYAP